MAFANETYLKSIAIEITHKYFGTFMKIDYEEIDEKLDDLDSIDNRILSDIFAHDIEIEDGVIYFLKAIVKKLHELN